MGNKVPQSPRTQTTRKTPNPLQTKKTKEKIGFYDFLLLKPVKNPVLTWEKTRDEKTKEEIIEITFPFKKGKWLQLWSKIYKIPDERRVALDKMGSFVWEKCDGERRVADIAQDLADKYKLVRQEAEISLSGYLQQLAKRGFIGFLSPKLDETWDKTFSVFREMKLP